MGLSEEEEIRLASLPVSIGSTRRVIIGYQDGDESNSLSLSPAEAHSLATRLVAAADEAEFVDRFTGDDIDAIDQAYRRAESREDWTKGPPGWLEDVRALRKPRT